MPSVSGHIDNRSFCIVGYHEDMEDSQQREMASNMVEVCKRVCDELELDYLDQHLDDFFELTMYVKSMHEGIQLISKLSQLHIYPNPTDEYRAFWASIFVESGGNWAPGIFREERALVTILRVMYEWMEEDEWMEQEFAQYNGNNYNQVVGRVASAVESIIFTVGERWQQAQDFPETRQEYPSDILLVGDITNGLSEEQFYDICRSLAVELLQEKGIYK